MQLTGRYDSALAYAREAHDGQFRKGTGVPYFAHLIAVSATVMEYDGDEDLAIAGLLHDAVEDQGGHDRLADIKARFGVRVARVVAACSDSILGSGERKLPWKERKLAYLAHLQTADADTLLVSLCDKVHNARSILRDLRKPHVGRALWQRFKSGPAGQIWYYQSLADVFVQRLPGQLARELGDIVAAIKREESGATGATDTRPLR